GIGSNASHLIKDLKSKILLETRNLTHIFMWVSQHNAKVVRVERDYKGRRQTKSFEDKGVLPIPIHKSRQYAEHHEEARQHKKAVKKIAAKLGIEVEVAEKLLPFIDAIFPSMVTNGKDWDEIDEQAARALEILSQAEWD
ncbi:MAG: hypothetical protein ACKPA7_32205, partial [Sphaerospermopsis kisseleviana]